MIKGPDSFWKWVTIGRMEISLELFSKNFAVAEVFGFFAEEIALIIFWWMLDFLEPIACANLSLLPTRFETSLNLLPLIFSNKAAFDPSSFAVTAATSYFVETFFFTVTKSLIFLFVVKNFACQPSFLNNLLYLGH